MGLEKMFYGSRDIIKAICFERSMIHAVQAARSSKGDIKHLKVATAGPKLLSFSSCAHCNNANIGILHFSCTVYEPSRPSANFLHGLIVITDQISPNYHRKQRFGQW